MPRTEMKLTTGWEFTLGDPSNEKYKSVRIPHDWVIDAPINKHMEQGAAQGFRDRWCVGWYRNNLTINEKKAGYRYYLDFGGVYENCTVWVNGTEVGGHCYGYSPFRFDVTSFIIQGNNRIEVKVDNTTFPADRWYSGGGIYRAVKLIEVEDLHFDECEIVIKTSISGTDALISVDVGINCAVKAVVVGFGANIETQSENGLLTIPIQNAQCWSAENPNLYTLTLNLMTGERVSDTISMRIGIREVSLGQGKSFMVNGQKVKLKGVCLHQDVGSRGIAAKQEIWRERLEILKEMGCNALRLAHHLFSEEFLDLCDEMGFYVYAEPFDKWVSGSYARYFHKHWQEDIEGMVKRDRNRACVIIWGTGNEVENQGQESMLEILKTLCGHIRKLDNTRPVTYAMIPIFKRESDVDVTAVKDIQEFLHNKDYAIRDMESRVECIKRIAEYVDIISCNYQEQWYEDIHRACPEKLILGTEVFQFFKGQTDEIHNLTNENPSLVPLEKDYVIGSMIWSGYDYLGESMGYPSKGWSGALIRTNNEKRFSYYLMQSYWSDKPMVHFSVMDYSLADEGVRDQWDMPPYVEHWHFPQYFRAVIPYAIATNCDEVTVFHNGKQFYVPKPVDCPNRFITGFLPSLPGTIKVIGYQNGIEVCSHELLTPKYASQLAFDCVKKTIPAEDGYEILLTVRAKDDDGNPCFRESGLVRFHVEGNAEIISVDNGNLMSSEPYNETFIHMYHGCASVMLRLTDETDAGRIKVYADADGLKTGIAMLIVG